MLIIPWLTFLQSSGFEIAFIGAVVMPGAMWRRAGWAWLLSVSVMAKEI